MARVLAINDLSCIGRASISVATAILSALSHEVGVLPTAVLSTQTGGIDGCTYCDMQKELKDIVEHWQQLNIKFDGILTGYMGTASVAKEVGSYIPMLKKENGKLFVDPVLGDGGYLYKGFNDEIVEEVKKLTIKADYIKPNQTEVKLLGESFINNLNATVLLTGVEKDGKIGIERLKDKRLTLHSKCDGFYHGAGDVFFSAFSGLIMSGVNEEKAIDGAAQFVSRAVQLTAEKGCDTRFGLVFEPFLSDLAKFAKE